VPELPELEGLKVVLVPGHDTACAFVAMPANPGGGDLYLSSGTWSLLGFESPVPILGPEALAAKISNERMGDGGYRPLKSCLGLWLLERALLGFRARPRSPRQWRSLLGAAGKLGASRGLLDLKDPSLFNPPSMRVAIDAQLRSRGLPPPRDVVGYVALICRSIARGHAEAASVLARLSGSSFRRILMVGGGSRNQLLCQATADASGIPVTSYNLEGAATGNIASQLVALRALGDIAEFRERQARYLPKRVYLPKGG
jgi:rhamnulokinase